MLDHRLQCWPDIKSPLVERFVLVVDLWILYYKNVTVIYGMVMQTTFVIDGPTSYFAQE